jgi:hypothetical protein
MALSITMFNTTLSITQPAVIESASMLSVKFYIAILSAIMPSVTFLLC